MDKLNREDKATVGLIGMGAALTLAGMLITQSGCGVAQAPSPFAEGSVLLAADERGMRAFGDMMVGVANEARTPTGMKSSHYQLREGQEVEKTKRDTAPGWLSKLFGGGAS